MKKLRILNWTVLVMLVLSILAITIFAQATSNIEAKSNVQSRNALHDVSSDEKIRLPQNEDLSTKKDLKSQAMNNWSKYSEVRDMDADGCNDSLYLHYYFQVDNSSGYNFIEFELNIYYWDAVTSQWVSWLLHSDTLNTSSMYPFWDYFFTAPFPGDFSLNLSATINGQQWFTDVTLLSNACQATQAWYGEVNALDNDTDGCQELVVIEYEFFFNTTQLRNITIFIDIYWYDTINYQFIYLTTITATLSFNSTYQAWSTTWTPPFDGIFKFNVTAYLNGSYWFDEVTVHDNLCGSGLPPSPAPSYEDYSHLADADGDNCSESYHFWYNFSVYDLPSNISITIEVYYHNITLSPPQWVLVDVIYQFIVMSSAGTFSWDHLYPMEHQGDYMFNVTVYLEGPNITNSLWFQTSETVNNPCGDGNPVGGSSPPPSYMDQSHAVDLDGDNCTDAFDVTYNFSLVNIPVNLTIVVEVYYYNTSLLPPQWILIQTVTYTVPITSLMQLWSQIFSMPHQGDYMINTTVFLNGTFWFMENYNASNPCVTNEPVVPPTWEDLSSPSDWNDDGCLELYHLLYNFSIHDLPVNLTITVNLYYHDASLTPPQWVLVQSNTVTVTVTTNPFTWYDAITPNASGSYMVNVSVVLNGSSWFMDSNLFDHCESSVDQGGGGTPPNGSGNNTTYTNNSSPLDLDDDGCLDAYVFDYWFNFTVLPVNLTITLMVHYSSGGNWVPVTTHVTSVVLSNSSYHWLYTFLALQSGGYLFKLEIEINGKPYLLDEIMLDLCDVKDKLEHQNLSNPLDNNNDGCVDQYNFNYSLAIPAVPVTLDVYLNVYVLQGASWVLDPSLSQVFSVTVNSSPYLWSYLFSAPQAGSYKFELIFELNNQSWFNDTIIVEQMCKYSTETTTTRTPSSLTTIGPAPTNVAPTLNTPGFELMTLLSTMLGLALFIWRSSKKR